MSKITKTTFKNFIRRNVDNLWIKNKSTFDGMVDCVMPVEDSGFRRAENANYHYDNNLGIAGVWLVLGSSDRFSEYASGDFIGIEVYNCCGNFVVATKLV